MRTTPVRRAGDRDLPALLAIAEATGVAGSAASAPYLRHLGEHGELLVAELDGVVSGYCGTRRIGGATMLCDLFVDPAAQGAGLGRRLLDRALDGRAAVFTFSSQDPRALPLYVRYGMAPRWPLLYLTAPGGRGSGADGVVVRTVAAGVAAAAELALTGVDRAADHGFWATAEPGTTGVVAESGGRPVAAGAGGPRGLEHLAGPGAGDPEVVLTVLAALGARQVQVPGPHPVLPVLLAGGWRIDDFDHHMSSRGDLVSPLAIPSPSLG